MFPNFPATWAERLQPYLQSPEWESLQESITREYAERECFPAPADIFRAFELTSFEDTRVLLAGQDPYHTPGAAMGLSFSIPKGRKVQPSLRNILAEVEADINAKKANSDLTPWARQGVLLLNSVLTVRSGEAGSHAKMGWEDFTNAVIKTVADQRQNVVFVLWGGYAQSKRALIDESRHLVITSVHPSPLSAYRGFFGSRPFSRANEYLVQTHQMPIDWSLDS